MNAREAMQALLDGKIVCFGYLRHKLNENGEYVYSDDEMRTWKVTPSHLNNMTTIMEEYPLTFKEAVMAMLDGKIVSSEVEPKVLNKFEGDRFYCDRTGNGWREARNFSHGETTCKWKVVEE